MFSFQLIHEFFFSSFVLFLLPIEMPNVGMRSINSYDIQINAWNVFGIQMIWTFSLAFLKCQQQPAAEYINVNIWNNN